VVDQSTAAAPSELDAGVVVSASDGAMGIWGLREG
jgi:hypothetical protein